MTKETTVKRSTPAAKVKSPDPLTHFQCTCGGALFSPVFDIKITKDRFDKNTVGMICIECKKLWRYEPGVGWETF